MPNLIDKLNQFSTYTDLVDVESELARLETTKDFDPESVDSVSAHLEILRKREGLDRAVATAAFRLEVLQSGDTVFTVTERLGITAAYDLEVRALHDTNRANTLKGMDVANARPSMRGIAAYRLSRAHMVGAEGLKIPNPLANASAISANLEKGVAFASKNENQRLAIRLADGNVLTGVLPPQVESYKIDTPEVRDGEIFYSIPDSLEGVHDLKLFDNKGSKSISHGAYPNLIDYGNQILAHPQLNPIRQNMGRISLNVARTFYLDNFEKSIGPADEAFGAFLPIANHAPRSNPAHRRRRF